MRQGERRNAVSKLERTSSEIATLFTTGSLLLMTNSGILVQQWADFTPESVLPVEAGEQPITAP